MITKKGIVIVKKVNYADSFFSQIRGLMFKGRLSDCALLFPLKKPSHVSIHMLFVFFPIEVLFLDEDKVIVDINRLRPFVGYRSSKTKISYVVELPIGTVEGQSLELGDKLQFEDDVEDDVDVCKSIGL